MRATIAPMVADMSLYQAIPGLYDALPEALKGEVDKMRMQPYEATLRDVEAFMKGERFDGDRLKLALAPTIPLHCS
ncbi:hypothetical protein, partial [Klebsiella pneumoniae]|uniref:hypothetical protein n=1 Tax=Klebsiella pneumoniae TaxID=573 RepID=UPI001955003E